MFNKISFPFYLKLSSVLLSIFLLCYLSILGQTILVPLIFGTLVAILLLPIANFLERKIKLPRSLSAIVALIIFALLLFSVFSLLGTQIMKVADDWPAFKMQLLDSFKHLQFWVSDNFHVNYSEQLNYISKAAESSLSTGTSILGKTIMSVSSILFILIFTLIYSFFILFYRRHLVMFLAKLFHDDHKPIVLDVVSQIKDIVKKYIIGLFLQMAIVTTLCLIAFSIIGIKYSFMLALFTGIFNVIPYIGILTGLLLAILITFATGSSFNILFVIITVVVIHAIDSNYIMPKVVGSKVKINSLIAMLGLVIGEMMWGVTGMFLSIPIIAILKIVFDHVNELKPWGYLLGEGEEKH